MKKYRSKSKSAMKYFILTAIFVAMCWHGAAQTTEDVVTELSDPAGLHIIGTNLYVTEGSNKTISKINLTTKVKTTQFVGTDANFTNPRGLALKGNDLYIAVNGETSISKIDLSNTPSRSLVVIYTSTDNLLGVNDIVLGGNTLYATTTGNKIVKIADITLATADLVVSDFITGIPIPRGLLLNGNNLYVTSGSTGGKLLKINTMAVTPIAVEVLTGLDTPTYMVLEGNNLYISERGTGKILKIDITETTPIKTEVLTGLTAPQGLAINNGYLYIAQAGTADKIVKFPVSAMPVASTNTFSKDNYRLFPNPVKDILFVKSDSEITSISISNVSGQAVLKGKGGNIDVRNLSKGIYFAKIISGEKVTVEKFIKM